jgi:Arc/MetJ-type ribon-helix-helix transcriptional regulator
MTVGSSTQENILLPAQPASERATTPAIVKNIDNMCDATHNEGETKGIPIASGSIHVKVNGLLQDHIQQQIGDVGLYENASEYIRSLIRRDLQTKDEAWEVLQKELAPTLRADDSELYAITAEDVVRRNQSR